MVVVREGDDVVLVGVLVVMVIVVVHAEALELDDRVEEVVVRRVVTVVAVVAVVVAAPPGWHCEEYSFKNTHVLPDVQVFAPVQLKPPPIDVRLLWPTQ